MKHRLMPSAVALCLAAVPALAEIQPHQFKVVGTWGNLASWNDLEKPFWAEALPAASGGALTAEAIPITDDDVARVDIHPADHHRPASVAEADRQPAAQSRSHGS